MRKTHKNEICFLNYTKVLGKNTRLLRLSHVFACFFAHKPYQNATPKQSVILALLSHKSELLNI